MSKKLTGHRGDSFVKWPMVRSAVDRRPVRNYTRITRYGAWVPYVAAGMALGALVAKTTGNELRPILGWLVAWAC